MHSCGAGIPLRVAPGSTPGVTLHVLMSAATCSRPAAAKEGKEVKAVWPAQQGCRRAWKIHSHGAAALLHPCGRQAHRCTAPQRRGSSC